MFFATFKCIYKQYGNILSTLTLLAFSIKKMFLVKFKTILTAFYIVLTETCHAALWHILKSQYIITKKLKTKQMRKI